MQAGEVLGRVLPGAALVRLRVRVGVRVRVRVRVGVRVRVRVRVTPHLGTRVIPHTHPEINIRRSILVMLQHV